MKRWFLVAVAGVLFLGGGAAASDWPIYKGNIFFTGNNDEITVKNNNLKWLFQAGDTVYNPIVSEGMVYFVDVKKNVYCLDEDSGKLRWKVNLTRLSSQFTAGSRAAGKVKYPLVKGPRLILTDNYLIYCLDKRSGGVLWARTGMRDEKELFERGSEYNRKTPAWRSGHDGSWDPTKHSTTLVDGIYSDPVINGDTLYYGTRNVFLSREIEAGHLRWDNRLVKSYSGFPSFYDDLIFTQSMDYSTKAFTLYCLKAVDGTVAWEKRLPAPERLFSPVVYRRNVYLASGSSIHCFALGDGELLWSRDYGETITSNPSFTEREILFTTGNRRVVIINPADGAVASAIDLGEKSSPYFVTIRDQIYVAATFKKKVGDRELSYASLRALKFGRKDPLWEFVPPFPGGSYQPAASGGIMFLPSGNYLYAVGTDYYPRIIDGGSAVYDPYDRVGPDGGKDNKGPIEKDIKGADAEIKKNETAKKDDAFPMRSMKITVTDEKNAPIKAAVEIKKWSRGKLVYSKRVPVDGPGREIQVPDSDDVEITADADGYMPKKRIISRGDDEASISLEKIEKGKGIVVDNIHFEIDEAYLKKESLNILDRMVESLKRNPGTRLEVRGHTDSTGSKEHNMKLSMRRADAVRDYMIKNGISPERLESKGFGFGKPIADNATAEGRRKNRRTEFFVLDK